MQPIQEIIPQLAEPKTIAITMHQKPDADAMGSALALYHFLQSFGHQVYVISPTNWARWLDWMEGVKEVYDYELGKAKVDPILDSVARYEWGWQPEYDLKRLTADMLENLNVAEEQV